MGPIRRDWPTFVALCGQMKDRSRSAGEKSVNEVIRCRHTWISEARAWVGLRLAEFAKRSCGPSRVNRFGSRAPAEGETIVVRANCVIALRSEDVSLVLDISNGQLPAIVNWGADLGKLELDDVEALILSNIDPAVRASSMSRCASPSCLSTGRAESAGPHWRRCSNPAARWSPWILLRGRRNLGRAHRVERKPHPLRGAALHRHPSDRRRGPGPRVASAC
jgi:hypothetical protein